MTITLEEANRAASAALIKARETSARISVSVCDPYGHVVVHQRRDGVFCRLFTRIDWQSVRRSRNRAPEQE
jgi:uncharacterized protein GlcG (DUF336 family)